jgi:hypothetical protein
VIDEDDLIDVPDAARLAAISRWIDTSPGYVGLDPEAHLRRRLGKINSESGEVEDALAAMYGENPRKPEVTGTLDDVIEETLDVAVAALGAVEHATGNEGRSIGLLAAKIDKVFHRAGLTDAPYVLKPGEFLISVDTFTDMRATMARAMKAREDGDETAYREAVADYERLSETIEVRQPEIADVGSLDLLADRDALARGERSAVESVVTDLIAASPNAAATDPEETP